MNTKSIKVRTLVQLTLSVPVTVKNISITAVVSIWVHQNDDSLNELPHEGYEIIDYEDTPEQMNNKYGVFTGEKASEFRKAYKAIYGSDFDEDVDIEVAKIMTKELVNRIVEESKPTKIVTSIDDHNAFYVINKKDIK